MALPDHAEDLERLLRRIIREEAGVTPVTPAAKWRGGSLVLRPGTPGLQEKTWPIETFFQKVVMLRNRLRTLEQQVNGSDLPDDVKVKLQAYVSGCYGSLTSFNVLFADDADQFKGNAERLSMATTSGRALILLQLMRVLWPPASRSVLPAEHPRRAHIRRHRGRGTDNAR